MVAEPEFGTSAVDFAALLDQPLLPPLAAGRVTSLNLGGVLLNGDLELPLGKRLSNTALRAQGPGQSSCLLPGCSFVPFLLLESLEGPFFVTTASFVRGLPGLLQLLWPLLGGALPWGDFGWN